MSLDEALRAATAETVAAALAGPLADLRAAVETAARLAGTTGQLHVDEELARLHQRAYLDASEAAKLIRTNSDEIYRLARSGALPATRFGKKLVFSRADLDEFMARHEHHAPQPLTPEVRRQLAARRSARASN